VPDGLGVGGGGRDIGVTGSLVGAGGELELVGRLQVGDAVGTKSRRWVREVHIMLNVPVDVIRSS